MKIKHFVIMMLVFLVTMTSTVHAKKAESIKSPYDARIVHIFMLAGQSNMSGKVPAPIVQRASNNVFMWRNSKNGWVTALEPVNSFSGSGFGPSLSFGLHLIQSLNTKDLQIGLINCAVPGSRIETWVGDSARYSECKREVDAALASGNAVLEGVIWSQGEGNTRTKEAADRWLPYTRILFNRIRRDFGNPNLPIVYAQLGEKPKEAGFPYWAYLQAIQPQLAGTYTRMIVTSDLAKVDALHFDLASQVVIGARFGRAFLSIGQ